MAIAVNIFPAIIFPWMLAFAVPQMHAWQVLQLILTQFVITVSAATFGFLAVIAIGMGELRYWPACSRACRRGIQTIAIVVIVQRHPAAAAGVVARGPAGLFRMASLVAVGRLRRRI